MRAVSLPSRTALGVALALLVILGVTWTGIFERVRYEEAQAVREVERENANLALAFREHTDSTVKAVDRVLQLVKHGYLEHLDHPLDLGELSRAGQIDYGLVTVIAVVNEHGDVVAGGANASSPNFADRDYFVHHRDGDDGELRIGAPIKGRLTGRAVIPFSRRIIRPDGSFGGVVLAGVEPAYFTGFYGQMDLGHDGLAMLVGIDGISRARRVGTATSSGEDMRGLTLMTLQAQQPSGSYVARGKVDGSSRYISYRTLSEHGLIVGVGSSR